MHVAGPTEVQQQTDLEIGRAEVIVQLPLGVAMKVFRRLDLEDQSVINNHVESFVRNLDSGVAHNDIELSGDAVPSGAQLDFQCCGVDMFAEAEAQRAVNREERPD